MPKITNITPGFDIDDLSAGNIDEISQTKSEFEKNIINKDTSANNLKPKVRYFTSKNSNQKVKKILLILFVVISVLFTLWVLLVKTGKFGKKVVNPLSEKPIEENVVKVTADLTGIQYPETEAG
ncbi:MAG TPA: hypothetical protein PKL88_02895, partial [bacterium]|nr:hypothetical protein [bacterium]